MTLAALGRVVISLAVGPLESWRPEYKRVDARRLGVRLRAEVFVLPLASLLLPPGVNRVRFLSVFGAAARLRPHVVPESPDDAVSRPAGRWVPWRVLLRYTFDIDPTRCSRCGRKLRTVATLRAPIRTFVALRWVGRGRGPPTFGVSSGP